MTINNIAVHKITKTESSQSPVLDFADAELDLGNQDILDFGVSLAQTYFDKKSRFYTVFKVEEDVEPAFKIQLDSYTRGTTFYQYSKQIAIILKDKMNDEPASRGGYIIVMDYISTNGNRYIFISLLNNKENFSVNDSLDVVKNLALNIENMAMASIVNLSRYENEQDNYITFIRGVRAIPDYFISFIGANKDRRSDIRDISKNWVDAIDSFFESKEISADLVEQRTNSLLTQIKNLNRNEDLITAEIIANIIYPDDPSELIEYIYHEDSEFELPSEMDRMDTQVLNQLNTVNYSDKSKGFNLKFKRKDIGTLINLRNNSIVITDNEIVENIQREIDNE